MAHHQQFDFKKRKPDEHMIGIPMHLSSMPIQQQPHIHSIHHDKRPKVIQMPPGPQLANQFVEEADPNARSLIFVTKSGFIKRMAADEFKCQTRGTKGKLGTKTPETNEMAALFCSCTNRDMLLFFSNRGTSFQIKAAKIPIGKRNTRGVLISDVLPLSFGETVAACTSLDGYSEEDYILLLTTRGLIKRVPIKELDASKAKKNEKGVAAITIRDCDSLLCARPCKSTDEIILASKGGSAIRYPVSEVESSGKLAQGRQSMVLDDDDAMTDMDILSNNANVHFLTITERGHGKRTEISEYRVKKRGLSGLLAMKFKSRQSNTTGTASSDGAGAMMSSNPINSGETVVAQEIDDSEDDGDSLRCMRVCSPKDEIFICSSQGIIIRLPVSEMNVQSRSASGALMQKVQPDDSIFSVTVVTPVVLPPPPPPQLPPTRLLPQSSTINMNTNSASILPQLPPGIMMIPHMGMQSAMHAHQMMHSDPSKHMPSSMGHHNYGYATSQMI